MTHEHMPAPTTRPPSSPATLWIAGLLTLVVVVIVIAGINASRAAHEDCMTSWRNYSIDVGANTDMTDPQSMRNTANAYRRTADGMRSC